MDKTRLKGPTRHIRSEKGINVLSKSVNSEAVNYITQVYKFKNSRYATRHDGKNNGWFPSPFALPGQKRVNEGKVSQLAFFTKLAHKQGADMVQQFRS